MSEKWALGQKVFVVERYASNRVSTYEGEIAKLGRKWITVKHGHSERRFGYDGIGDSNFGYKPRMWPSESAYQEATSRNELWDNFRRAVDRKYSAPDHMTIEQIKDLLAAIQSPTPQDS